MKTRVRNGPDLRRLLFRSPRLIVEADETELVEHVGLALDRASSKLERVKQRLKDVQEEAAAEVRLLTEAETKLSAAIVVALLSTREGKNDGS
jgi:hypothetical protein